MPRFRRGRRVGSPAGLRWQCVVERSLHVLGIAVFVAVATGCYSYSVVQPADVAPGLNVRARLTPVEAVKLEEQTNLQRRLIEGVVVSANGDDFILAVPTTTMHTGISRESLHQRIALSGSGIVEFESRRLDRFRTFGLLGIIAAVTGAVVLSQFGSESGEPVGDKPGGAR